MIYLVEDDNSIRELVIYTLQSTGFEAAGFSRGKDFWDAVRKEKPALVLLDIMLPDEDGLTILKKIRNAPETAKIPVIMLTAKGTEYDKVIGLDSGADDYIPCLLYTSILSSVGATAKQLQNSVLFEGLVIGAAGIPVGVLAGIGSL